MSAPDTNVERQAKRHRTPLAGIAFAVFFGFVIAVVIIGFMDEDESSADAPNVNPIAEGVLPEESTDRTPLDGAAMEESPNNSVTPTNNNGGADTNDGVPAPVE